MSLTETYILCEGYHDRAFWAGALLHLGCTDPGIVDGGGRKRRSVLDPWNKIVGRGNFGYRTASDHFMRIVPAHGRSEVMKIGRERLESRRVQELSRLVLSVDSDLPVDGLGQDGATPTGPDLLNWVKAIDPGATLPDRKGDEVVLADGTRVNLLRWRTADSARRPGVPDKQTLERVLCEALVRAHPDRVEVVECWLKSRPMPPASDPKDHAFSYLAGWWAKTGSYESAIERWWEDPAVHAHLVDVLTESGCWRTFQAVAAS
jgi:hypothetical protein